MDMRILEKLLLTMFDENKLLIFYIFASFSLKITANESFQVNKGESSGK